MPIGGSGVSGEKSRSAFGDLRVQLDLVSNADLYQERLAALEDAEKRANAAKSEAGRILKNAKNEAEEQAKAIIDAAEEQAQDRLNAIQDLEAKLSADKSAWTEEKAAEESKLRSDRSRLAAATRAAKEAKEQAEKSKADMDALVQQMRESRQALVTAANQTREAWKKVGI